MGRKEQQPPKPEPKAAEEEKSEPEDSPLVKQLKGIDDKYLEVERELMKAKAELRRKYEALQQPLLEERAKVLAKPGEAADASGTPALKGFWLQALKNLPQCEDIIEEWDIPVLGYLKDIKASPLDPSDDDKGFKLHFYFAENPFFTNEELWKEFHTEEASPYTQEINAQEIKVSEVDWKEGKDVTVELVAKKVKGGGAKKAKAAGKTTSAPRDSFFRCFFRPFKVGEPLPDDMNLEEAADMADDDDEMLGLIMENELEIGSALRHTLVPFAVRWYTGEARPESDDEDDEDDDDDDDDDSDDDGDDDSDEDDEEDETPVRGKKKAGGKGGGKGRGNGEKAQEECKQQ